MLIIGNSSAAAVGSHSHNKIKIEVLYYQECTFGIYLFAVLQFLFLVEFKNLASHSGAVFLGITKKNNSNFN